MEGILLAAGGIVFVLSFFLPAKEEKQPQTGKLAEEEIKKLVEQEMKAVRSHVDDVVDEAVGYAVEKTERSLERLSNEKIMAVNEYSDTVLSEIHRNHEEAMFLYDMLNNKQANLKAAVSEVNRTVKEAEEAVNTIRRPQTGAQEAAGETGLAREEKPAKSEKTEAFAGTEALPQTEAAEESSFIKDYEGNNSNDRIMNLYRQGKSRVEIAKELELGVGEVKLVIDLFKNQKQEEEVK